ncbi:uncharacterized protein [Diadema setosum]|uniref:uncharacterized protein n=1 Tax=Diadema setosum TaxID=31175 RepID=UPI003B3BE7D4
MGKRKTRDKGQDPPPKKVKQTSKASRKRAQSTVTDAEAPGNQQQVNPPRTRTRRRNGGTSAAAETTAPQREPSAAQADVAVGMTGQQPPHPRTPGEFPMHMLLDSQQTPVNQSNNLNRQHTEIDGRLLEGTNRFVTSPTIPSSFPSIVPNANFLLGNMERGSQPSPGQCAGSQPGDTNPDQQQNEQPNHTEPQAQGLPQNLQRPSTGTHIHSHTYHQHQSPLHPAGDRLGTSIPHNIREKIWKGEFIDLNLLIDNQDHATQVMQDMAEQERANLTVAQVDGTWVLKPVTPPPTKNKIFSIEAWTNAFLVYMSIYIEAHPTSTHDLLKYCHLIRSAASRYRGLGWRDYDKEFRHRLHRKGGAWAIMDGELWLLHVVSGGSPRMTRGFNYPPQSTRETRGTERRRYQPLAKPNRNFRPSTPRTLQYCYDFNNGTCTRRYCRYMHKCMQCGKNGHKKTQCSGKQPNAGTLKPSQ